MEQGCLMLVLGCAAIFDGRTNRIPNLLCFFSLGIGLLLQACDRGITGILSNVLIGCFVFFPFYILWRLRVLGGGDGKLAILGSIFLGRDVIPFLLCGGITTAVLSLLLMISRQNFMKRMRQFIFYVRECVGEKRIKPYPFDVNQDWNQGGVRVSYGFFIGHVMAIIGGYYRG